MPPLTIVLPAKKHADSSFRTDQIVWHGLAGVVVLAALPLAAAELKLSISGGTSPRIEWPSENGVQYRLESATRLPGTPWDPVGTVLQGTGQPLWVTDTLPVTGARFYRVARLTPAGPQISPQAVEPATGGVYPGGTFIGSALLGRQFTIPANWKAGLRDGASSLLIVSDTEPGLVIGLTTLAGDAAFVGGQLAQSFWAGQFGGFEVQGPAQVNGTRIVIEWQGVGFSDAGESLSGIALRCHGTLHPSGGVVAFIGLFTEPNRAQMRQVLDSLTASVITVPRQTRTDLVNLIAGKSFSWTKSSNTGSGGNSGSLQRWTEKNAFFCPATYEITTRSESSFSGNLSGGGFYTGGSSDNSTEAGDWTVVDTASGPVMVMLSAQGSAAAYIQISGNSVYFGDQQFDLRGFHACP